jgi:hypothetical protein
VAGGLQSSARHRGENCHVGWDTTTAEDLLESLVLDRATVASVGWLDGMRDLQLDFEDGRSVVFRDCVQVAFHRPLAAEREPLRVTAWWADEPSPVLLSIGPEIRFSYQHLVIEIGEALLRVAYRSIEVGVAEG